MQFRQVTKNESQPFKLALAQLFQDFLLNEFEYLTIGGYSEWGPDIHDLKFTPLENGHLDFYLNESLFYVTVENELPIAMVGYWSDRNSLVWFYVSPEHQRKGIGRKLFQHVIDIHKPDIVYLTVKPNNLKAIKFYESLGLLSSSIIMVANLD